ncbi:HAD-IA family hydrolase [Candidatus Woesearchaeota archaeon]|nr:HAD-IA family hydrolase [Candidatus Woesearchaeota archaeon]
MIKAITFDLDNTLIDFINFKKKATAAAIDAMIKAGFKGNRKKFRKELFDFYLSHGIESDDVFSKFLKNYNNYSERILAAGINSYLKTKYSLLKPYPKVKSTLKELKKKGIMLAIVTDAPRLKAYMRLDEMGIAGIFDVVVGKEDTLRQKPSTLPFRKALKLLKVDSSEAMHVGDWPERDILGAKRVGMKTCFARYGYLGQGKVVWADYKIKRFEELMGVVKWRKYLKKH